MRSQRPLFLFLVLCLSPYPVLMADEHRQLASHVHGEARLDIGIEGQDLVLELESPAMDILGFEHEPASEAEHKKAHEAEEQLRSADALFTLPENAQCKLTAAEVKAGGGTHEHEKGGEEGHRDFDAQYAFRCAGGVPGWIEVRLFDAFPSLHRLHVQLAGPKGQKSAVLSVGSNRIEF